MPWVVLTFDRLHLQSRTFQKRHVLRKRRPCVMHQRICQRRQICQRFASARTADMHGAVWSINKFQYKTCKCKVKVIGHNITFNSKMIPFQVKTRDRPDAAWDDTKSARYQSPRVRAYLLHVLKRRYITLLYLTHIVFCLLSYFFLYHICGRQAHGP